MQVAYQTGSVSEFNGANGLLKAITDFVAAGGGAGQDWTLELDQNAKDNNGVDVSGSTYREVILSNVGVSGNETIIVGLREYEYPSNNEYGLELNGYLSVPPGWNSHALATHGLDGYDATRDHWDELPQLQCFDNEMEYWMYSSREFIIIAIRVGTSYYQCYLGNGQRLSSPNEHPYPLVIAGSHAGNVSYQDGGFGPVRPRNESLYNAFFVNAAGVFNVTPSVDPMQGNSEEVSIAQTDGSATFMCPVFYRDNDAVYLQLYNMYVPRVINMLSEQTYEDNAGRSYRFFAQGITDKDYEFVAIMEDVGTTTTTSTTTTTTSTTTTS